MDWVSVWSDIVLGLLISGALAAWVPNTFWKAFFLVNHPLGAKLAGPLIGPLVAVVSFVCSVGNVPMAAVLWNGGISFGGVVAFLFADLIILPILYIYRKYYGWRIALILTSVFYAAMVLAGYAVELIFGALHLVPPPTPCSRRDGAYQLGSHDFPEYRLRRIVSFDALPVFYHRGPKMLSIMSSPANADRSTHGRVT